MFNHWLSRAAVSSALALMALAVISVALTPPSSARPERVPPFEPVSTSSQTLVVPQVITTVQFLPGVGKFPRVIGVNPVTGYIYVASSDNTLIVSGTQVITSLQTGSTPEAMGVNPTTGYVYLTDASSGVAILSGTQLISTVATNQAHSRTIISPDKLNAPTGGGPMYSGVGVNPATGYVYVGRYGAVMVLSETQVITTLLINSSVSVIGVNPATGYVYVASDLDNNVTVISGTEVVASLPVGAYPTTLGVNPMTGYIYIGNANDNTVTVISATQVITTLTVGSGQHSIDVNPNTGFVYVANDFSSDVTVISATQIITTLAVGHNPSAVGVNPVTGYVYVSNYQDNSVSVLSATEVVTTFAAGAMPYVIGVNSATGYIYLTNFNSSQVTVLSDTRVVATFKAAIRPGVVDVNPATGYVYVGSSDNNEVLVLSNTQVVTALPVGGQPIAVKVNPQTGYIYILNNYGAVTIISATQAITSLAASQLSLATGLIDLNPMTGYVYVADTLGDKLTIISGTQVVTQITGLSNPVALLINPTTGYVYEASWFTHVPNSGGVAVISGTQIVATPAINLFPVALGLNPTTGYVYVVGSGGQTVALLYGLDVVGTLSPSLSTALNSISPDALALCCAPTGGGLSIYPGSIGASSRDGYVYVADPLSNSLHALSGFQVAATLDMSASPAIIGASPSTGYVYAITSGGNEVLMLKGPEIIGTIPVEIEPQTSVIVPVEAGPQIMAFDPIKQLAYIANYNDHSLSILQEPIVPRSLTPSLVDTATTELVIDFSEPVVTSTVQFVVSPAVAFTVTWDVVQQRATLSHLPFQSGKHYSLSLLSGGETATAIPIVPVSFDYVYYPYKILFILIFKNH